MREASQAVHRATGVPGYLPDAHAKERPEQVHAHALHGLDE